MTREDTFLDYDLWLEQQSWTDEDWRQHEADVEHERIERERLDAEMTEADRREMDYWDGLYNGYADEVLAMNEELPAGYKVTWHIAAVWPRYVLWHDDKPLAGFKHENKQHVVPFAKASPEAREAMMSDFHNKQAA